MNTTARIGGLIALGILIALYFFLVSPDTGSHVHSVPVEDASSGEVSYEQVPQPSSKEVSELENTPILSLESTRDIYVAERITLPLANSAPTENVRHSIPIEEIRRGCFRQDCIPSVDDPEYIGVSEANALLPLDTIGIGLVYKGVARFYPFNMLVTREIVNDVVAGDPLLVTYCPLCGTGVVFDRVIDGTPEEFGVSGMLWQSNLLMYNRAPELEDRNLWSQVLGEAVVGTRTGTKLKSIPSNIVRYTDWREEHPQSEILNTGRIGDPYGGDYYSVARSFAPNFDEASSPLDPSAYVFGIEIDGGFKAYPRDALPVGTVEDVFMNTQLTITKNDHNAIQILDEQGNEIPVVSGFWFSWIAAHPETELWDNTH